MLMPGSKCGVLIRESQVSGSVALTCAASAPRAAYAFASLPGTIEKNALLMYMIPPQEPSEARMLFADLNASPIRVSVGFAVATVGKLPLPTIQRFGTSCERWLASTTDVHGSVPIRWVPMTCPAP